MSLPTKPTPPNSPPPGTSSSSGRALVAIALAAGCLTMLCCGGVGAALLYFVGKSTDVVEKLQASIQEQVQPPLIAPKWENEWMINYQLTPVFTAALDAVSADKQVQEKLGEPIESAGEADELFRRERKGELNIAEETIEFDIRGSKGTAVVKVTTNFQQPLPGRFRNNVRPQKITVLLADGTEIDVPPPKPPEKPEQP